jgi:kynurenine formamidase
MKILDFTLTYEDGMRGVVLENVKTKFIDGWNSKTLHLYSHAGTHMDAPISTNHTHALHGRINRAVKMSTYIKLCPSRLLKSIYPLR